MEGTMEISVNEAQALADYKAFVENTRRMNEIVAEMKEIPFLPSEQPGTKEDGSHDINPLEKVEFPSEGGVLTYMGGYPQPYKGFPFFEFVDKIDVIKKIQRATLSSLYHSLKKKSWWQLAPLILVPWLFGVFVRSFIYSFYRMVDRFKIKPLRYCTSMRELHRCFSIEYYGEKDKEMRLMLRDLICMFLEFDNAYRFRFQDVIVELDKENLKKHPVKEIRRLFVIMSSRENTQEIKDTWKLVQYFLPLYMRLNKSLRVKMVSILSELNLEKMALSVEDKVFSEKRKDYKFDFQLCQQTISISEKDLVLNTDIPSLMPLQP